MTAAITLAKRLEMLAEHGADPDEWTAEKYVLGRHPPPAARVRAAKWAAAQAGAPSPAE
jgi:hypothetical protein